METSSSDLNHTVPISILVHQASCTPVHNCTAGLRQPRKSFGVLNTSTPAAKQSAKRPKTVAGLTQCQEATLCHPHNIPVPAGGSKQFPGAMPAATAAALAPHQRMELNLLRMASITAPKSSRTCAGQRTVSAAGCRVLLKFPRPGPRARARGSALSALWGPGFGAELVHCLHATNMVSRAAEMLPIWQSASNRTEIRRFQRALMKQEVQDVEGAHRHGRVGMRGGHAGDVAGVVGHLGLRELEPVRGGDDDRAVIGADDAALAQLH